MKTRPRTSKVELLIGSRGDVDRNAFRAAFTGMAEAAAGGLRRGVGQTWSLALLPGEMAILPHQVLMKDSPAPFDAIIQFASNDAADLPAMTDELAKLARELAPWLDPARSAVLVGQEIPITQGIGPVMVAMPLRRLPQLSHEEFMKHWFERHASLGEAVEGVRYWQNHVDATATGALAARLGLHFEPMDGLTESYFMTTDEAVELLSREEIAVGAIDDEKRFIDHPRSQFGLYRAIVQQPPAG